MVFLKAITGTGAEYIASSDIQGVTAGATTVVVAWGVTPKLATYTVADAAAAITLSEGIAGLLASGDRNANPNAAGVVQATTLVAVIS